MLHLSPNLIVLTRRNIDKTQVFHDQIEAKQKELQPWTAQINAKQADVDVASSEREALAEKAKERETARKDAEGTLDDLKGDHEVNVKCIGSNECIFFTEPFLTRSRNMRRLKIVARIFNDKLTLLRRKSR